MNDKSLLLPGLGNSSRSSALDLLTSLLVSGFTNEHDRLLSLRSFLCLLRCRGLYYHLLLVRLWIAGSDAPQSS